MRTEIQASLAWPRLCVRLRGGDERAILRLDYKRNTLDVADAVARLRAHSLSVLREVHREDARYLPRDDLHQRLFRGQHRACRRTNAAGTTLCEWSHRDAGGDGVRQLRVHGSQIQNCAHQVLPWSSA